VDTRDEPGDGLELLLARFLRLREQKRTAGVTHDLLNSTDQLEVHRTGDAGEHQSDHSGLTGVQSTCGGVDLVAELACGFADPLLGGWVEAPGFVERPRDGGGTETCGVGDVVDRGRLLLAAALLPSS